MPSKLASLASLAAATTAFVIASPAWAQYAPQAPPSVQVYYQPTPPPPPPAMPPAPFQRGGFVIGFSIGGGSFDIDCVGCSETGPGGSFALQLGGMVAPDVELMGEIWGVSRTLDEERSFVSSNLAAVGRWFVLPRAWIQGGLGFGRTGILDHRCDDSGGGGSDDKRARGARRAPPPTCSTNPDYSGLTLVAGAGYELYQGQTFALDLSLRAAAANYDKTRMGMATLTLGFTWY